MSITQSQIDAIRKTNPQRYNDHFNLATETLLQTYELELRVKALASGNKLEVAINRHNDTTITVVGTPFLHGAFIWHKAIAGARGYTITHVKTTASLGSGTLANVKQAITYLCDNIPESEAALLRDSNDPINEVSHKTVTVLRDVSKFVTYGHELPSKETETLTKTGSAY